MPKTGRATQTSQFKANLAAAKEDLPTLYAYWEELEIIEAAAELAGSSGRSNCTWNVRKSARPMPEPDNFNPLMIRLQPVDDAIGTTDDFAQVRLPELRHHSAYFREVCQILDAGD